QQPHVVRLETRPPNIEGKGEIRQRELVKNALRMRPDRVILGEVRSEEAFDMLQAMNTGHEGSMATIHSNNPREAISRLEQIVGMEGNVVRMQDIFTFNRTHTDADGTVHGEFRASGLRPRCLDEMQRRGI